MSTLKETISAPSALQGEDDASTTAKIDCATRHHQPTEGRIEAEMPSTVSGSGGEQTDGPGESPKNIETVALVVEKQDADFKLMPITLDEVRSDELLVEMKFSGICHTVPPLRPSPREEPD